MAHWSFDRDTNSGIADEAAGIQDPLKGMADFAPGVRGRCLLLDGFTTFAARAAGLAPKLTDAFTVEAWIVPQEYSWNWTAIVDHSRDEQTGFFLGINYLGHVGLHAAVDGRWLGCESKAPVPLLKWTHVAGTFDPETGLTLYVNGEPAGSTAAKGKLTPANGLDLLIGRSHRQQFPALTEREPSKKFLSPMVFDGLLDEVKIYARSTPTRSKDPSQPTDRPMRNRCSSACCRPGRRSRVPSGRTIRGWPIARSGTGSGRAGTSRMCWSVSVSCPCGWCSGVAPVIARPG